MYYKFFFHLIIIKVFFSHFFHFLGGLFLWFGFLFGVSSENPLKAKNREALTRLRHNKKPFCDRKTWFCLGIFFIFGPFFNTFFKQTN